MHHITFILYTFLLKMTEAVFRPNNAPGLSPEFANNKAGDAPLRHIPTTDISRVLRWEAEPGSII